jgi:drug/metabolite transporter (DMT)-like permease
MNPVLALIITNIIWGAAPPIFKFALTGIPPFTLAFIRFFFGALLFIPIVVRNWQKMSVRDFIEICVGGFLGISVNIAFFFLGLQKAESINVTIIGSAGPVFLYLISILFLKEKPNGKVFMGMLIALLGVCVIIFSPILMSGGGLSSGKLEGNFYYVIATLGAVLYPVISKRALSRINPFQVTFIGFIVGALTFMPLMVKELATWSFTSLDMPGIIGIFYGVFFSSFLAYLCFNIGTSKIKAQEIGLFSYIDPVAAVLVAMPLLHEIPSTYFLIGAVFVIGGIFIAEGRLHYHPFHLVFATRSNPQKETKKVKKRRTK